jgi:hypothetical protein
MVFTNTVKVKFVGMGWGRIIMIKKKFKIHGVECTFIRSEVSTYSGHKLVLR